MPKLPQPQEHRVFSSCVDGTSAVFSKVMPDMASILKSHKKVNIFTMLKRLYFQLGFVYLYIITIPFVSDEIESSLKRLLVLFGIN